MNISLTTSVRQAPVDRIMIASLSRLPGSVVEQLLALRPAIRQFNEGVGLRSALLYNAGWFVQWHEGTPEAVDKGWRMSEANAGHGNTRVIHRSIGVPTLTETLNIATLHGKDKPTDMARRLYQVESERLLGIGEEPAQVWRWLSAPAQARPQDEVAALARQDVLALTSEDTESMDLIKAIADRARVPVTYQRFANGDLRSRDAGAAYADLPCDGYTTRVQALSRRALGNSLVRLSLQQMQRIVLLLGARARSAENLLEAVSALIAASPTPPQVHLLGASPEVCRWAAQHLAAVPGLRLAQMDTGLRLGAQVDAVLGLIAGAEQDSAFPENAT
ncbi:BLUF domain-containing protein [Caenimonas sedimenti]|uniref:BLUF domain-containing protein n=1 Tax=Caenimonas sedimenti TaxID=2596921 RepID=A0A562ZMH7_9BURK|nr:BLUF domain-containing protein [Caenimonas sedimenti]TWO69374.1 BLUF domain-containing protein [Caenimonas sedimenti]